VGVDTIEVVVNKVAEVAAVNRVWAALEKAVVDKATTAAAFVALLPDHPVVVTQVVVVRATIVAAVAALLLALTETVTEADFEVVAAVVHTAGPVLVKRQKRTQS
jgi:hypothetical protein